MTSRPGSKVRARVQTYRDGRPHPRSDQLATEEPLEIRIATGSGTHTVAITMRTPGTDFELAAGFLHGEGVVRNRENIRRMTYCTDPEVDQEQRYNIVNVELANGVDPDLRPLERHFTTTSACGVCGKAHLDQLDLDGCAPLPPGPTVEIDTLYALPDLLRGGQGLFEVTGGLHAAGLFTVGGDLLAAREDVGRHNAVDKLFGWSLLEGQLPAHECILMNSGRSSYEILQKALTAGVPIVCSVSAPSSLAVELAARFGITLVGFLRDRRCNVYAGAERIRSGVLTGS
ncbi:MAG: formate dehydrogenase accessory sulfurtransferase FdhD [Egibacteraceae bacterium]